MASVKIENEGTMLTRSEFIPGDGSVMVLDNGEMHLGSVRVIADKSGEPLEQNDYYPFGLKQSRGDYRTLAGNRYRFNGKELQTTGGLDPLLDYGARMYDPKIGRWFVQDPLADKYYPVSPYAYCLNNPIRYVDPKGKDVWDFIEGVIHSVGSNLALGTVPTNTSFVSDAGDYNAARTVGDVISVVMGAAETIVGGGAAAGGSVATVGTAGAGSPVTVPVTAVGVGMVKKLVDELKEKGWVFTYIGANQDVEQVAATISITNVMNFQATHQGTQAMFQRDRQSRSRWFDRVACQCESEESLQEFFFEDDKSESNSNRD